MPNPGTCLIKSARQVCLADFYDQQTGYPVLIDLGFDLLHLAGGGEDRALTDIGHAVGDAFQIVGTQSSQLARSIVFGS